MPTFNQLVRKGRDVLEVKSTAPALQKAIMQKGRLQLIKAHLKNVGYVQQ